MPLARLELLVGGQPAIAADVNDELDHIIDWLNADNLTAANIEAGSLISACFTDDTLDGVKLLDDSVPAAKIVEGSLEGGAGGQLALATIALVNMLTEDGHVEVAIGTYVGDDQDPKTITCGFEPDFIYLSSVPQSRIHGSHCFGNPFVAFNGIAAPWSISTSLGQMHNDAILSITGTGFTVKGGGVHKTNDTGFTVYWIAFRAV